MELNLKMKMQNIRFGVGGVKCGFDGGVSFSTFMTTYLTKPEKLLTQLFRIP